MENKKFERVLIKQVNYSLGFLFRVQDVVKLNPNKTIKEVLSEYERLENFGGKSLINPGIALAAAFMYFIYPRESIVDSLELSNIDFSNFRIVEKQSNNPIIDKEIIRRLRNSLAHGNFTYDFQKGEYTFIDDNRSHSDYFEMKIIGPRFGEFIESFAKNALGL